VAKVDDLPLLANAADNVDRLDSTVLQTNDPQTFFTVCLWEYITCNYIFAAD